MNSDTTAMMSLPPPAAAPAEEPTPGFAPDQAMFSAAPVATTNNAAPAPAVAPELAAPTTTTTTTTTTTNTEPEVPQKPPSPTPPLDPVADNLYVVHRKRPAAKSFIKRQSHSPPLELSGTPAAATAALSSSSSQAPQTKPRVKVTAKKPKVKVTPTKKATATVKKTTPKTTTPKTTTPKAATSAVGSGSHGSKAPLIYEGVPTEDIGRPWPEGWVKRTFQRLSGATTGRPDHYWFTPQQQYKLRSVIEVKRFIKALEEHTGGDEAEAKKIFKGIQL